MNKQKLTLIVPCYNEEMNVLPFYESVKNNLSEIKPKIIFINDGSKDKTNEKVKELINSSDEDITLINFSRNFGKEAAIYAGLLQADTELTCLIDADLQQNPKYVKEMYDIISKNDNIDMVTMYQKERKEGKIISSIKKTFYNIINKLSEIDFVNGASDFRMFNSSVKKAVLDLKEQNRFSKGIFSWVGFNTCFLEYEVEERRHGTTKWSLIKLFKYALKGIISFSTAPLKLATITGIISSIASVIYLIFVIIQKLTFGIEVSGYATIIVLLLFFGGLQLLVMGITGEYIGAIYIENKNRPIFIAKEIVNNNKSENNKSC